MADRRVPVRPDHVVFQRLQGGDAVLLHLGTGRYHSLNAIGAAIWEIVDGSRDIGTIVTELRTHLEDAPLDLTEAVATFLDELAERDLIRFSGSC